MFKLGVRAALCSLSGYAEVSRSIVTGLDKLGVDIYLEMIDDKIYESSKPSLSASLVETIDRLQRPVPKGVPIISLCTPPQYYTEPGRFLVGYGLFEAHSVPQPWLIEMNKMNLIITMSTFNQEVFVKQGISRKKIEIVSPAVDSTRFHPSVEPFYSHVVREFPILFLGQLILRKGWDKLLIAALRAFNTHENVCVILKLPPVRHEAQTTEMINKIKAIKLEAGSSKVPIYFNNMAIPTESVPRVYQIVRKRLPGYIYEHLNDGPPRGIFALPSLGEGAALPYLEAMSSGLLVLGTNVTGSEYLNPRNAVIVNTGSPVKSLEVELEHSLYRGAVWPRVDVAAVEDALLRAYNMDATTRNNIETTARKQAEEMTYLKTCQAIINAIQSHM